MRLSIHTRMARFNIGLSLIQTATRAPRRI